MSFERSYKLAETNRLPARIQDKLVEAIDGDPELNAWTRDNPEIAARVADYTQIVYGVAYGLIQRMNQTHDYDE